MKRLFLGLGHVRVSWVRPNFWFRFLKYFLHQKKWYFIGSESYPKNRKYIFDNFVLVAYVRKIATHDTLGHVYCIHCIFLVKTFLVKLPPKNELSSEDENPNFQFISKSCNICYINVDTNTALVRHIIEQSYKLAYPSVSRKIVKSENFWKMSKLKTKVEI